MNDALPTSDWRRFWSKVNICGGDECWPWLASRTRQGYGYFYYQGKMLRAHRYAYDTIHKIKLGKWQCLHTCDNPPCCNPKHLRRGTNRQAGEGNGRAKLTRGKVRTIRKLHNQGVNGIALAKLFNVTSTTIYYILQRRLWKEVL